MRICVGVRVFDQPNQLQQTLESLRANTQPAIQQLLLPDGPDEITSEFLSHVGVPQLGTSEPKGGPACLNRLSLATDADVVILLESGSIVGPGWLDHLLGALTRDPRIGLAGPSTNRSWNEQCAFPRAGGSSSEVAATAELAVKRFGSRTRTLEPLYSLADFCYAVRREVLETVGQVDELYGLGPCWEMDYNIRAARAGFQGVWACASYVYRAPFTERRQRQEASLFEANKRHYQDKFCGMRLRNEKKDYRAHCRGECCPNFAPMPLVMPGSLPSAHTTPLSSSCFSVKPLVSCIMPTYNRRQFVPRAIGCFLRQDYDNAELVIVDDGSDPIADLVPHDERVRYVRLPQKLILGAKRNHACQCARGEIILHWDDDDWYPPNRVRTQVRSLLENRADVSGTSRLYYYDASSGRAFLYRYGGTSRPWVAGNTLAYRRGFWERNRFPNVEVGEDSRLVWSDSRASIVDLKDPSLCVASIHETNVSPKNTGGAYWIPEPPERILAILGEKTAAKVSSSGPLVSCIMPTYNRRSFIPLALLCFRAQSYPNKELVVVDDGSDSVADILEPASDVRYFRMPQRLTIGAKRNLACREARGEIVAHWDDDDWYAPTRLEEQVAPIVSGKADITGLANRFVLEMPGGHFWSTADDLHRRMFVGNVHGGTLVYRKSMLREGIRYPDVSLAEDASLIHQAISRKKRLARLENTGLFVYLRHGGNAWKFEAGQFINPDGWRTTAPPTGFSASLIDMYRNAAESVALAKNVGEGKLQRFRASG